MPEGHIRDLYCASLQPRSEKRRPPSRTRQPHLLISSFLPLSFSTSVSGSLFDQPPRDHESSKGLVFLYFSRGVDYLPFLRETEACLSFAFSFPAPFRPLSTEATVGTGGQRQYHYARQLETLETNTTLVGRWGGER